MVFYNADVFAKAGIPTPLELSNQGKWTWETMRDTSRQLVSKQSAKYGLLLNNNIFTNGFRNMIDIYAAYGAAPWSDDGQTCTINSPQAVQATQFIWDMIYTDKSLPGPGVQADWTAGNIGMVLGRANAFNNLGELPFKWEIVSVPDGPSGFVPERAQNGIAVWADAPNTDLAAEFVLYTLEQREFDEVRRQYAFASEVAGEPGRDSAGEQGPEWRTAHPVGDQGAQRAELQAGVQPRELRCSREADQPGLRLQDLE